MIRLLSRDAFDFDGSNVMALRREEKWPARHEIDDTAS
jgi:hypothetical protein